MIAVPFVEDAVERGVSAPKTARHDTRGKRVRKIFEFMLLLGLVLI
jgi:hypothetical protein